MKYPIELQNEARNEGYAYFDKNIRKLPRNLDGSFSEGNDIFVDSDVDAFRHAYVSGVFTQEYGASVADMFGRLNELTSPFSPGAGRDEMNMDLWNNAVGRKYGEKFKSRDQLLKAIDKALKDGELIISPNDRRTYEGAQHITLDPNKPVIVLSQSKTGRNEIYYDVVNQSVLSREEFLASIKRGEYLGYTTRQINGIETPVSKPDNTPTDNLG